MPNLNFDKNEVFDYIQKDGLYTIENFLNSDEVASLKDELVNTFDQMETGEEFTFPNEKELSYPFGKICRVSGGYLGSFPNIVSSFNHSELHELTDRYFNKPHNKLFQVFFSHLPFRNFHVNLVTQLLFQATCIQRLVSSNLYVEKRIKNESLSSFLK